MQTPEYELRDPMYSGLAAPRPKTSTMGLASDELDRLNQAYGFTPEGDTPEQIAACLGRWLVELAATVGQYQYMSAVNNTFDLQRGRDADPLPIG